MVIRTRTNKAVAKAKAEAERQAELAAKAAPPPAASQRPLLHRFFDSSATLEPVRFPRERLLSCAQLAH